MEQAELIWHNGEFVPWEEAKVHVLSHGLHYGTGVFEGIRCYETERGPAIFRHRDHLDRLAKSAELFYLPLPHSVEEIAEATRELIRRNGLRSCYIRPLAFRGYGEMGLYADSPMELTDRRLALGRLPRRRGQARRDPRQGLELAPDLPGRADPARQGLGPVPELDPRQDRVQESRLRGGDPARRARLRLRGLGREHLPGPRRRDRHAAARRRDPRRDQPQVGDPDRPRPRLHRGRARHRPRRALPGRGDLLHRAPPPSWSRSARSTTTRSASRARSPASSRPSSRTPCTGAPRSTWSGSTRSRSRPGRTSRVR